MIEFTIDRRQIDSLINKLSAISREDVLKDAMQAAGHNLAAWIKMNRLTGPRPQFLGVKTGNLRASIAASPTERAGKDYITRIGTNVIYAPIHEYGGVIRAKAGGYLAFQIENVRTTSKRTGGPLKHYAVDSNWVRVKQVTIPARPFMRPAIEDKQNREDTLKILIYRIKQAVEKQ